MGALISIIVPVYQVEDYITNTINSILSQTYTTFEVVIVNDGSMDNSIEIARSLLESSDISFRIISQENKGIAAARNSGIRNSKGDWILMVDSDDVISPYLLERSIALTEEHGLDIVFCNSQIVQLADIFKEYKNIGNDIVISQDEILKYFLIRKFKLIIPGALMKKDALNSAELWFDETIRYGCEQHFTWRLLLNNHNVGFIQDGLYNYLQRGGNSIMASSNTEKVMTGYYGMKDLEIELKYKHQVVRFILPRWIVASLNAASHRMNYKDFQKLAIKMNYSSVFKRVIGFPDFGIVILAFIMKLNLYIFYRILRSRT